MKAYVVRGQGLAGSCLAWRLKERGAVVRLRDARSALASSRVAAGLVNPLAGRNFHPGWRYREFRDEAVAFYEGLSERLGVTLWHPMPVVRKVPMADWNRLKEKLERPEVREWVEDVSEGEEEVEVVLRGGGRVACREFCEETERVWKEAGDWEEDAAEEASAECLARCEGAAGLVGQEAIPSRCAQGEILTVRGPWPDDRIVIGHGGWLAPVGKRIFKCGATYSWDPLDGQPTRQGRGQLLEILMKLGGDTFQIVEHLAGVRPIIRRSQPVIGRLADGSWFFNGLGSKGSLYAPGVARRLAEAMRDGAAIDPELDLARL